MEKQKTISYWQFILFAHLSALLAFAIIRGIQILNCSDVLKGDWPFFDIIKCFWIGMFYDTHCSFLALAPVTLVLGVQSIIGKENKRVSKIGFWVTAVIYFIEILTCCANIVYVKYQLANINFEAVKELGMGIEALDMITTGPYLIATILSIAFCVGFVYLLLWLFKRYVKEGSQSRVVSVLIFLLFVLVLAIGIRGRSEYQQGSTITKTSAKSAKKKRKPTSKKLLKFIGSPLNTTNAEYSEQLLFNLSAVNDFFYIEKSVAQASKGKFKFMPNFKAEKIVTKYQNYPHEADPNCIKQSQHIFLVLMEGMSAKLMKTFGYSKVVTPFLDSIYAKSLSYDHFYSAGIVTQKGMCSTFSSAPTFSHFHSLEKKPVKRTVISTVYKHEGYTTQLFIPHGPTFDNVFGFFEDNPFDYKYCLHDYPEEYHSKYCLHDYPEEYHSFGWGAPDEYLYNFAFNKTDSLIASGVNKTMSVVYGCSNHPPYNIPESYYKKEFEEEEVGVFYADAQLRMFYNKVRSTEWGKNALFVFVADHGRNYPGVPHFHFLTSNHIPFIINHPEIEPRIDQTLGVQYDVLPTMLALTGINYKDYLGYGIDLAHSTRDTVFFSVGDRYVVKTKDELYIYTPETRSSMTMLDLPTESKYVSNKKNKNYMKYMKANLQYGLKFATTY